MVLFFKDDGVGTVTGLFDWLAGAAVEGAVAEGAPDTVGFVVKVGAKEVGAVAVEVAAIVELG